MTPLSLQSSGGYIRSKQQAEHTRAEVEESRSCERASVRGKRHARLGLESIFSVILLQEHRHETRNHVARACSRLYVHSCRRPRTLSVAGVLCYAAFGKTHVVKHTQRNTVLYSRDCSAGQTHVVLLVVCSTI